MSEFLALHYESKYDFLLHLYIFISVTGYKRIPFGRFLNSKKYQILITYRKKHLNIESKRNKHFIKPIIHKEVLKLQNCEIVFLWLHFWSTRSMKTPKLTRKTHRPRAKWLLQHRQCGRIWHQLLNYSMPSRWFGCYKMVTYEFDINLLT
jgi:hypothetical protein